MKISIIFPIPGLGKYSRQPLYAYDFCKIILSCIQNKKFDGAYNISGREKIFYIDLIRKIKLASNSKAIILCIPYSFFHLLLRVWGFIDKNPPFTPQQLEALVADDNFEVIDWPNIFAIDYTTLDKAIDKTFKRSFHSEITLDF